MRNIDAGPSLTLSDRKPGQIQEQLNILDTELAKLTDRVCSLSTTILPICYSRISEAPGEAPAQDICQLAAHIRDRRYQVEGVNQQLQNILESIEL